MNLLKPLRSLLSDLATNDDNKAKNEDDDSSDGDDGDDDDDDENVKNCVDIDDLEVLLENRLSAEGVEWKEPGTREYQRRKYHCTIDLLFDCFGISYINIPCRYPYPWVPKITAVKYFITMGPFSLQSSCELKKCY